MKSTVLAWLLCPALLGAELPDISSVPPDLVVPALSEGLPAPGKRVRRGLGILYLPVDWRKEEKWPLIVELPGNGGYSNAFGDVSTGLPEGSCLGYGLSGGRGFIWLCAPFLNAKGDRIATVWWGDPPTYDPQATLKNLRDTVRNICEEFSGDESRIVLAGFSRGSIACNYLGLHDDQTARLWRAFFAYSHYEGVRPWPYPESTRESALSRLHRLGHRPQFICGENDNAQVTAEYLRPLLPGADLTFVSTGFRNHNDAWILRPSEARTKAREWLRRVVGD